MIKKVFAGCLIAFFCCAGVALGADVREKYPIGESLKIAGSQQSLSPNISFYWGDQSHPPIAQTLGTFKTSKRSNAFGKSRGGACARAMLSALIVLQERAEKEGGNAVVNIVSNIKNQPESSSTAYTCLAGKMMVNVALKGTVVKLAQ